ncbi:DAK2 domain-containing protein, partial [Acinetobacter baumannii]|uniref:DAK2 domain-containing protein n=1 Tax=Acinetobacter baumannii TaxID=470 RepID=UPI0037C7DA38
LNVFPVPDGDTGTNMNLTFQEGKKQLGSSLGGNGDVGQLAGQFARGLLMGARGNSGVILSQLFRGFAASLKGRKTADAKQLAQA